MKKKKTNKTFIQSIGMYDFDGKTLEETIEFIQIINHTYKDKYKKIVIEYDAGSDHPIYGESPSFTVYGIS